MFKVIVLATLIIVVTFFASSPHGDAGKAEPQHQAYSSTSKEKPPKTFWEKTADDPVAAFTATLCLFTFVLAAVSVVQIYFLTKADETSRIAANAARTSADALTASERAHVIEVIQKGRVDHTPAIATADDGTQTRFVYHGVGFSYFLKNFGKTPATIIGFHMDVVIWPELPDDGSALLCSGNRLIKMDKYVLGSGDATNIKDFQKSIGVEFGSVRSKTHGDISIIGYIKFSDVFGGVKTRHFMWIYDGALGEFRPVRWQDHNQQ